MKKLITLTFAFMLSVSMAFAQNNTAETRQNGDDNDATVEQSGSENYGGITQGGTNGTAIIEQVGQNNQARDIRNGLPPVDQGAPAITGIQDVGDFNFAQVRQNGNENVVGIELTSTSQRNDVQVDQGVSGNQSFGSVARIGVKDDDNTVDLDQRGTNQRAEIRINRNLTGDDNGTFNTVTALQQGADNIIDRIFVKGHDNDVDVTQDGLMNEASVQIGAGGSTSGFSGNFNIVDISQSGDNLTASTRQGGSSNEATTTQSDSDNEAEILQGVNGGLYGFSELGAATANEATIDQSSTGNAAFIQQGTDRGEADLNTATLTQSGTNGSADIIQGVGGSVNNPAVAEGVKGIVDQGGSDNSAFLRQGQAGDAIGGSGTLTQTGSGNTGIIFQAFGFNSYSEDNTATLTQNGTNSGATINQSIGSGGARSISNNASILQEAGNNNDATLTQGDRSGITTSNSVANLIQNGDDNVATGVQSGDMHNLTIDQMGNGHEATATQMGTNNTSTITQN